MCVNAYVGEVDLQSLLHPCVPSISPATEDLRVSSTSKLARHLVNMSRAVELREVGERSPVRVRPLLQPER